MAGTLRCCASMCTVDRLLGTLSGSTSCLHQQNLLLAYARPAQLRGMRVHRGWHQRARERCLSPAFQHLGDHQTSHAMHIPQA